jgi:hypothetical protein
MKKYLIGYLPGVLSLLLMAASAPAANWYVRPGGAGSQTGADWNNAWDSAGIGWSSVSAGDTIWLAGGTYSGALTPAKSGTSSNPIYIRRVQASDSTPTAAAGWSSSFDSQVIIAPSEAEPLAFLSSNAGSYTYWDGRVPNGISLQLSQSIGGGGHDACIDVGQGWGDYSDVFYPNIGITFTNIECVGTYQKALAASTYNCYSTSLALNNASSITMTHCNCHDTLDWMLMLYSTNILIDHTIISNVLEVYDGGTTTVGHANLIEVDYLGQGWNNLTIRYCQFSTWDNEGLRAQFNCYGALTVYGCTFWQPNNTGIGWGRAFEADTGASVGLSGYVSSFLVYCYNNTFVNVNGEGGSYGPGVWSNGTTGWDANSQVYNNLYWNCISVPAGFANEDYEYSDVSLGEAHSVLGTGATPFVNAAGNNFNIVATLASNYPREEGTTIANTTGNTFNVDMNGTIRGAGSVPWSIGAYEYNSGVTTTNPAISISPGSLTFGAVLTNTTATNSITVANGGGGTLTGTASVAAPFSILSGGTYSLGAGQSQTVSVGFAPGASTNSSTQTITFTGGGGATATVSGSGLLLQVMPGLSFASYAGTITAPMVTNSGGYIYTTADVSSEGQTGVGAGGLATYYFMITNAGQYTVSAMVSAPNSAAKSFWLNIDSTPVDPTDIWDVYPYTTNGLQLVTVSWRGSGTYTNDQYSPQIFNLTSGLHQLIVAGREANVELGQITINSYSASRPAAPQPPSNLHVVSSQ